jgi:hypothetical protein
MARPTQALEQYGTEWGIRWDEDHTEEGYDREEWYASETIARGIHGMYRRSCVLISRPLYRGPATEHPRE